MSTSNQTDIDVIKYVGNSWIVCRSKTYAGRIYYFNTETGEAAWNLSEADIEKAKKTTKNFVKQSNFKLCNYPEPSGSPQDNSLQDNLSDNLNLTKKNTPNVYNEQITTFPNNEIDHFNSLNTLQFNNPVSTLYNPLMSNIPSQPVLLAPMNQIQAQSLTQANDDIVLVSSTSITLSNRFKSCLDGKNTIFTTCMKNIPKYPFSSMNRFNKLSLRPLKKRTFKRDYRLNDSMDLRLLLCAKRRSCRNDQTKALATSFEDTRCSDHDVHDEIDGNKHIVESEEISGNLANRHDDYWLEENMKSYGLSNPIDTRTIRNVIGADENLDHLYIVTDTSVLLYDINFLNMLLYSDMQCHLVVPQVVMNRIESAISTNLRTRAQKAAYLISKQINAGFAAIDENIGENIDYNHEIINCCLRLVERNCYMILLTNDEKILQLQNETNIPMLSVSETKKLACNVDSISNETEEKCFDTLNLDKESNIKITVDNDRNEILLNDNVDPIEYSANDNTMNIVNDSYHDDVVNSSNRITLEKLDAETTELINEKDHQESTHLNSLNPCNKNLPSTRRILLKRSISSNTSVSSMTNERKQYKWHRKRAKTSTTPVPSMQSEDSNQNCNSDYFQCNSSRVSNESLNYRRNTPSYSSSSSESSFNGYKDINVRQDCNIEKSLKSDVLSTGTGSNFVNQGNDEKSAQVTTADRSIDSNVMFEVTSQVMEDCLKMKCDEWVSRFVQIMEEVLTQLLRRNPPLVYDNMPPPWTVYEATECIKRSFHDDGDVVDAAHKFCNVLFELGGLRGKIKINISPQKYMEMYSYGVYLIDALQGLYDCEDLQTAAESLSKLLSDIQESHLDQNNHDSFGDMHDTSFIETANSIADATKNISITESILPMIDNTQKPQINKNIVSPGKYNLRSQSQKELQLQDNTTRDLESTFFTCLHLQKNPVSEKGIGTLKEKEPSMEADEIDAPLCEKNDQTNKETSNEVTDQTHSNAEPKIIRNFVKCLDIEEKLKSNYNTTDTDEMYYYEDEELDYEEMDAQYYESEYDEDEIDEYNKITEDSTSEKNDCEENVDNSDDSLKCFIQEVLSEAKRAFDSIYTFCKAARDQFDSSDLSKLKKNEIYKDAEKTHSYVLQICSSLDGILKRETSDSKYSIQKITESPEFNSYDISEEDLIDYRRIIKKYLQQGNVLKESVRLLIDASK